MHSPWVSVRRARQSALSNGAMPRAADSLRMRARRKQGVLSEVQTMYEGMRWVLFSNR